ncbi:hypothetical protein AC1031_018047 [Aphanomyces cochlioides]|nr:hypothetical protein AC1031_018046 [Aphanomyces cochlioides]KAG9410016.1 hypothetical protein AC1031_018047 [Aphanomyces cochlioides]
MVKLFCVEVGEERAFPVDVAADENVGDLKDKIKEKKPQSITCDADRLGLYRVDGLTQTLDDQIVLNGAVIDLSTKQLSDFSGSTKKLVDSIPLSMYPQLHDSSVGKIHVLVVRPEGAVSDHTLQAQSVEFQDAIIRQSRRQNQLQTEVLTAFLPHKSDKSYTDGALVENFDKQWLRGIVQCSGDLPNVSELENIASGSLRIRIPVDDPAGLFADIEAPEDPPLN